MDEQTRSENETREALVAFAAAALEVALDAAGDDDAPARDFGLDVRSFAAEEPDDKGAHAILVTLQDGRAYRVYASVVPA